MTPSSIGLCPHCSSDILGAGPDCWLCHRPLPAELVERTRVEVVLRGPMMVGGSHDLQSTNFGLIFLVVCLAVGGFTLSVKFGALVLVLLLPAGCWLLMDHAPARRPKKTEGAEESSSAAAWTIAAIALLPVSLALALVSTGLAAFDVDWLLDAFR